MTNTPQRSPEGLTQQEAWDVVMDNTGLVKKVTDDFTSRWSEREFDDFLSVAYIAAHQAVMTYDPSKATKLSYWMWIVIQHALASEATKVSRQTGMAVHTEEGKRAYTRYETPSDFTTTLHSDDATLPERDQESRALAEEGFEDDLVDLLSDAQDWERVSVAILTALDEREQRVLELHYFEGKTFPEVGKALGVSQQRAHQIKARAIQKLRAAVDVLSHQRHVLELTESES